MQSLPHDFLYINNSVLVTSNFGHGGYYFTSFKVIGPESLLTLMFFWLITLN